MRMPILLLTAAAGSAYALGRLAGRGELRDARHEAHTDHLTGLTNRAGLTRAMDKLFGAYEPYQVMLMDLDGFKTVNDMHGHRAGDQLLRGVASRLNQVAAQLPCAGRSGSRCWRTVTRLGGDEFVLVVHHEEDVIGMADEIRAQIGGLHDAISASVGIAYARPGANPRQVLHAADRAMYQAKRGQHGVVVEYDVDSDAPVLIDEAPPVRLRDTRTWPPMSC